MTSIELKKIFWWINRTKRFFIFSILTIQFSPQLNCYRRGINLYNCTKSTHIMYYLKRSTNFLFFWRVIHSHILDFSRHIIFCGYLIHFLFHRPRLAFIISSRLFFVNSILVSHWNRISMTPFGVFLS